MQVQAPDEGSAGGGRSSPSICFVATSPAIPLALTGQGPEVTGGAELQTAMLAKHLAQLGWRVVFLVNDYGQETEVRTEQGITLRKAYERRRLPGLLGKVGQTLPHLWRSLGWADADVYLMRGADTYACAVAYFCQRAARAFVHHCSAMRDVISLLQPWWSLRGATAAPYAYAARRASMVVVQSVEQERLLVKRLGRPTELIPNACVVGPPPGAKPPKPVVFWAGSLRPIKRPELLLQTARQVPEVEFVLAGPPAPKHEALAERVKAEAAGLPNVRLAGLVPNSELREMLTQAHALMNTSVTEGFPNAFLEAWAAATPVVATVDPDGVMKQHQIGFHCPEPQDLVEKVRRVCADPQLRDAMGRSGRQYVEDHHAAEVVLPRYEALLRDLCAAGH